MLVNGRKRELEQLIQDIEEVINYNKYSISSSDLLEVIVVDLKLIAGDHKPTQVADFLAQLE